MKSTSKMDSCCKKYDYCKNSFRINQIDFEFYNLELLDKDQYGRLPFSIRIFLESLVRNYDSIIINDTHIDSLLNWRLTTRDVQLHIPFLPARILFQDFSSVPAIIDLACIREKATYHRENINPTCLTHLILDHSIVDSAKKLTITKHGLKNPIIIEKGYIDCPFHGCRTECAELIEKNRKWEFDRCQERLSLLKWSARAFNKMAIIPPLNGISHQMNIEYITRFVNKSTVSLNGHQLLYPDTLLGTDTNTVINNGLGVLSLNVGAIEAEQAMLGQPFYFQIPKIICIRLMGKIDEEKRVTSIDLVISLMKFIRTLIPATNALLVGKDDTYIIEFIGPGLEEIAIIERQTITQMVANDFTNVLACYFPFDRIFLEYIRWKVPNDEFKLIDTYLNKSKLFYRNDDNDKSIDYMEKYDFDLGSTEALCSGPKRTHDKVQVNRLADYFYQSLYEPLSFTGYGLLSTVKHDKKIEFNYENKSFLIEHGTIIMASIMSYTNPCNPSEMLAAGLLAKKALDHGLTVKPYITCNIWPGSGLLTKNYLTKSGLVDCLQSLGFSVTGYGCSKCIENTNEIGSNLTKLIEQEKLITVGVLSGNRNYEARINSSVAKANYLLTPSMVIAYAIAGTVKWNPKTDPIGFNSHTNEPVFLSQIWPTRQELFDLTMNKIMPQIYLDVEKNLSNGFSEWNSLNVPDTMVYPWNKQSTYIKYPPFLDDSSIWLSRSNSDIGLISDCRVLLFLTDSITNDCISPAGSIPRNCSTAKYLLGQNVLPRDFNSFGSRRGNHEVMARGTYTNQRLNNRLIGSSSNSRTLYIPNNTEMDIFEAAECYRNDKVPLIIIAGKNYGIGSSRDWSVKGPWMLGIRAILAESFDPIHKTNLICMGILPLRFMNDENPTNLKLTGKEVYKIGPTDNLQIGSIINIRVNDDKVFKVEVCIDNQIELAYYKNGGLLKYFLQKHTEQC